MHKVEKYVDGRWVVVASFCLVSDAYAYARGVNGIVLTKDEDANGSAACNRRLDWLEANCGWFAAADER